MNDIEISKKIENEIISIFSKEDFLLYLEEYGFRDTRNKSYFEITKDACRYGVLYMILAISKKNRSLLKYIRVARGRKGPFWHCFLNVGTKYVDMTIAQFDKSLPELFIIDKNEAEKYYLYVEELYTVEEWFEWEESN